MPYISQLNTLGTVERAMVYNPATMKNEVNDYDNSLLILLFGVISLSFLIVGILLWMANVKYIPAYSFALKRRSTSIHLRKTAMRC